MSSMVLSRSIGGIVAQSLLSLGTRKRGKMACMIWVLLLSFLIALPWGPAGAKTPGEKAAERWWSHVQFLADDKLEGRDTGSEGYRKAAEYVAERFRRAGLKPAGAGGYFQPVKFRSRRILEEQSSLTLVRGGKEERLVLGEDAYFSLRVDPAAELEAPLVFAGYGLVIPELKHDDLAGLDVRGKLVVHFTGAPTGIPGPLAAHYQSGRERSKFLKAAGAVGVLAIQNPRGTDVPWARATLNRTRPSMSLDDPALDESAGQKLAVTVNAERAEKLFAASGHSFKELLALAVAGKPLPSFALPAALRARARVERRDAECRNVVGVLPGADPKLRDEYVVLSAHLDHVGVGNPIQGDGIYNGAMDNASGVAALLEIAESLAESKTRFRRSLLFVALTGEEKGLLGSRYFTAHPTVPIHSMVADLNMDMFMPLFPLRILTAFGSEESDLGPILKSVLAPLSIQLQTDPEPERNRFIRSDQYNFIRRGIPALAFKVGYEKGSPEAEIARKWIRDRYHSPSDDLHQPVSLSAAGDFIKVLRLLAEAVADRNERPRWNPNSFFRRFAD